MSLADAISVVWDDQPVQGASISALASMKALKEVLSDELQTPLAIPVDIGNWVHDVCHCMAAASLEDSPEASLKHRVPVLLQIIDASGECTMATATAVTRWSSACGDGTLAICADLLITNLVSQANVFPVYSSWRQNSQEDGGHRLRINEAADLLVTRIEHMMSMVHAILSM